MAKTTNTSTRTRSIEEIVEDFVLITDSGSLRYGQAKLAFEFIGNAEGKDAADLREVFRKNANEALRRKHESELSQPGVTNLVNTWKYLQRANVDTNEETNPAIHAIAKASFNLASQTFKKKEDNYVNPAIKSILDGTDDPEAAFIKATAKLKAAKKADADSKDAPGTQEKTLDEGITFDSIVAMLQVIPSVDDFTDEQKSILRDLLATASVAVA